MGHYAKVLDGKVIQVIRAEEDFFDSFVDTSPGTWVQTSYNTREGKHLLGGTPLRKNFAGIDYTYDEVRDAFIPPKPYASWVLNEETCNWDPPTPNPTTKENYYIWNEEAQSWELAPL